MKYVIEVRAILEYGQRKDEAGNPHQEDCLFPSKEYVRDSDRLFILCDGMGGHAAGEVASATVCETMSGSIFANVDDPEGAFNDDILNQAVSDAFDALDAADTSDAAGDRKMGTTMTLLKLHDRGATIAHMGDSRVYHLRPGNDTCDTQVLFQTRDHSLVNDLVAIGELTPEQARTFPQRNIITRALQPGTDYRARADIHHVADIRPGDYFFLCSDGMLEAVDDNTIPFWFSNFESVNTIDKKVQLLLEATETNSDNHSAFLVHILDVIDPLSAEEQAAVMLTNRKGRDVTPESPEPLAPQFQAQMPQSAVNMQNNTPHGAHPHSNAAVDMNDKQARRDREEAKRQKKGTLLWASLALVVAVAVALIIFNPFGRSGERKAVSGKRNTETVTKPRDDRHLNDAATRNSNTQNNRNSNRSDDGNVSQTDVDHPDNPLHKNRANNPILDNKTDKKPAKDSKPNGAPGQGSGNINQQTPTSAPAKDNGATGDNQKPTDNNSKPKPKPTPTSTPSH